MIPNVKIAVVDQEELTRDFVVDVLAYSVNREVLPFEDGVSAWQYLENKDSADIVVTDADLPGMDGAELIRRIKKQFPQKICVMMADDPKKEELAGACGTDAFLAKPFTTQDLFDLVQKFVVEINRKPHKRSS